MFWALREIESKSENRTVRNLIGNKFNGEYIQLGFFSALPLKHKKPLPEGRGSGISQQPLAVLRIKNETLVI